MRREKSDKKPKCWNCGDEGHIRRNCRTPQRRENKAISQQRRRKQINDHIVERSLKDGEKPRFKTLKISAVSGSCNGLSMNGHIDGVPSNMIIDMGAIVNIIRKYLAQQFKDKLICTPSCVTFQTALGDKIDMDRKLNVSIMFGSATYCHMAYVADITDPSIFGFRLFKAIQFFLGL
ncbi:uncharacterized protein LOC118181913 [Stegodyphus dumicola]|uniref:uncharacterized protein LOC118181913 n=1 Tax=Stegodyphus dumicola TaxID=202533 RepID=UPI0015A7E53B|nr:uncharacterized protein LOC118181913 [Stegodyphus dumicola]